MRKLIDDDQIPYNGRHGHVSVSSVYERIKKSNSSLNRKSKRLLEDSIERVIAVIADAEADVEGGNSASASDGERDERQNGTGEVRQSVYINAGNKQQIANDILI